MREERAKSDQVVAKIAGRQHGVVSAAQLGPAGIDKDAVPRRVKACRIHRIHRGVYAVGHTRLTFEGRCMAAVLALGGAVIGAAVLEALGSMAGSFFRSGMRFPPLRAFDTAGGVVLGAAAGLVAGRTI